MVSTKLNIGKIPISKGEYQEGTTYQRLNQVTMLGSTYQSKIDDNTSAPAKMGADGAVENINTDKWLCIAVGNVSAAKKVVYNNETSGLEAGNVQEAIDEVISKASDLVTWTTADNVAEIGKGINENTGVISNNAKFALIYFLNYNSEDIVYLSKISSLVQKKGDNIKKIIPNSKETIAGINYNVFIVDEDNCDLYCNYYKNGDDITKNDLKNIHIGTSKKSVSYKTLLGILHENNIDNRPSYLINLMSNMDDILDGEDVNIINDKILMADGSTHEFSSYNTTEFITNNKSVLMYVKFNSIKYADAYANVVYYDSNNKIIASYLTDGEKLIAIYPKMSVRISSKNLKGVKKGINLKINTIKSDIENITNKLGTSLLIPDIYRLDYKPTNYGDNELFKQKNGHKYLVYFISSAPLNQKSFFLQLWNDKTSTSLNRNLGDVWKTEDTSKGLIYRFTADNSDEVYFKFAYYKEGGLPQNVLANYYVYDETESKKYNITNINENYKNVSNLNTPLQGIKISWYGTSIPAQGYPQLVGEITGASVTNECQGSSACRRGAKTTSYYESNPSSDPMRIKGLQWAVPVYGLMMSAEEKDTVFANWKEYADTWTGTYEGEEGAPTNAKPVDINDGKHEELKATLRDLCYDVRVARHLGISHKYNTKPVDVSDVYIIEHCYNDVQPMFKDTNEDFSSVPTNQYDVNTVIGSINALIKYIYENNPTAKILLIGHYECELPSGKHCKQAIELVADYWKIPLLKLYDILGVNQKTITTNGYWDVNNVWHNTGFTFTTDGENWTSNNLAFRYSLVTGNQSVGKLSSNTITGTNATTLKEKLGIVNGNGTAKWNPTKQMIYLTDNLHPSAISSKEYFAQIISKWLISNI